jgi:hypothetical protein
MNAAELKQRLLEEGCSPYNFSIGRGGSDVYCLDRQNGVWRVFYTERGKDDAPIFEAVSEAEACEFYFEYITKKIQQNHLVGFFVSEKRASDLEVRWTQNGILFHRDKIPCGGWSDPCYRVFVVGKDISRCERFCGKCL